jgi:hypothetical protein
VTPARVPDLEARLPWLNGRDVESVTSVHLERRRVRCGKTRCRCTRGELHGPYYYLRFSQRRHSRQRVYVSRRNVRKIRRWVRRFRDARVGMHLAWRWISRGYCP